MAGVVFAQFNGSLAPPSHLRRPLLIVIVLSVPVGVAALAAGRRAVSVAAAGGALLVAPIRWGVLAAAVLAAVFLLERILRRTWDLRSVSTAVAMVFLVSGAAQVLPHLTFGTPAHADEPSDGPPTFLVLLDGYPRVDTLADLGIDNSPFISELEARGFDHYPDAHTEQVWTFDVLSVIFGEELAHDASLGERRRIRDQWRLPAGWVMIPPAAGHVTILDGEDLSPGGVTWFEVGAFKDSLLGRLPGVDNLVMGELRRRLASDLATLGSTDHDRVFAHFIAPHPPFLYGVDGAPLAPPCFPCERFTSPGWVDVDGLEGTIGYLNGELLAAVDRIVSRFPDAVVVLFSDHGGRFDFDDEDEWRRSFLAARTPGRSGLFADDPTPGGLLPVLGYPTP